jgi:1-acyl-sn-glycerol-3-phosphate acyltransferase
MIESLKRTRILKSLVYFFIGIFTYPRLALLNKIKISGTEHLKNLPKKKVLFVSNHQTYFADVITFLHIFCAVKWGKQNKLGIPYYLLNPFTRVHYVAAEQTMKANWISKLFKWAGAITVKRVWLKEAKEKQQGLGTGDTRNITRALEHNWVITFPQGTTKPFAAGRKGTGFIIKHAKPVVIPVVISGFSNAFDKTGLKLKKKGSVLSVHFKEPLQINYNESVDGILEKVMDAIEQSPKFIAREKQEAIENYKMETEN